MKLIQGKMVDAKSIRMNLKKHWTRQDFMSKYGISEEEFDDLLKELFHGNIGDIKRQLRKNESLKRQSNKTNEKSENEVPKIQAESPQDNSVSEEILVVEANVVEENEVSTEDSEKASEQEKINQLLESEQIRAEEERKSIIALEISHEKLISRKRAIQGKELPELKEILQGYKKKIQEAQLQVVSLNEELNSIVASTEKINADLREKREHLQVLEDEIDALKIVNIFVYGSGEIEISASIEIQIPNDNEVDWIRIVSNNGEQCRNMTIAQIQSVAKVIKIIEELKSWQTAFEDDECQKLFDNLIAKQSK